MSKSVLNHNVIFLTVCAVLLSSCSLQATSIPTRISAPANTATTRPATATASPAPQPTFTPTDTPFPSPTPLPWPSQPISAENAGDIKEINRWGRGTPIGFRRLERGDDQFLVLTSLGVYLYQTTPPYVLAFFPESDEVIVSQDESLMAISLKNGDVQIWNMADLSLRQTFKHTFPEDIVKKIEEEQLLPYYVGGMAFSPDNSEIAVGYADGAVELYRLGETASYVTLRHDSFSLWQTDVGLVYRMSYSPDGKNLVVFKSAPYVNANRLTFWRLPEGKLISVSEAARFHDFTEPAYLPDGQTLLVSSRKDSYLYLTLWNVQTGAKLNSFATGLAEIISTEITPDGKQATIYGGDAQQTYYRRAWTLPDGKLLENEKLDQHPNQEYWTRIDKFLFEQGHYENYWSGGKIHPNVARVAVTGNQTFRVLGESHWLMFPEGTSQPLDLPEDVDNLYYDRYEQTIAWCTRGALHFIDRDDQAKTFELPFLRGCHGIVISPQRHYAVIWYSDLYLINLETGKFSKFIFDNRWPSEAITARFSVDEKILITIKPGLVTFWQVDPLQKIASSEESEMYPDNNLDVVISKDESLAVTLQGGDRIEAVQNRFLIWRVNDAVVVRRIDRPYVGGFQPTFTTFALSHDFKVIATGDNSSGIRLWSVETAEQLAYFDIDALPLDLAFTPDGSGLIGVLDDGTVRLWGVP